MKLEDLIADPKQAAGMIGSLAQIDGRLLVSHLIKRGLVDPRDMFESEIKVFDVSGRNLSLRVTTTLGDGYFVKQALGEGRLRTISREAAFLCFAADSAPEGRLRACLPAARGWDADNGMLVCDLIPGSRSLADHQRSTQRFSSVLAGRVGSALAALHDWQPAANQLNVVPIVDSVPPWILLVHRPDLSVFDRMSGAGLELIKVVQSSDAIREALDQLRSAWQASAIIHGDLKWDNVVVYRRAPEKRAYDVILVDWEMVQLGDPLWDAASFLSQYLDVWVASIPVADQSSLAASPSSLVPLERVQPAMTRFWSAYDRGRNRSCANRAIALKQVARYAAARLIQTAIEAEQHRSRLGNPSVLRLQVAENMLRQPAAAVASLFGIPG